HRAHVSLRTTGLDANATIAYLTNLASDYTRTYARERISTFGVLSRARTNSPTPNVVTRSRRSEDVEQRLLDRLDPATQFARLSRFLMRTRRLAALRGRWMYFYTDVRGGHGLVGVNI